MFGRWTEPVGAVVFVLLLLWLAIMLNGVID